MRDKPQRESQPSAEGKSAASSQSALPWRKKVLGLLLIALANVAAFLFSQNRVSVGETYTLMSELTAGRFECTNRSGLILTEEDTEAKASRQRAPQMACYGDEPPTPEQTAAALERCRRAGYECGVSDGRSEKFWLYK